MLDRIVEVYKFFQLLFYMCQVTKVVLIMPHFHQSAYDTLCFTIGLWTTGSGVLAIDLIVYIFLKECKQRYVFLQCIGRPNVSAD